MFSSKQVPRTKSGRKSLNTYYLSPNWQLSIAQVWYHIPTVHCWNNWWYTRSIYRGISEVNNCCTKLSNFWTFLNGNFRSSRNKYCFPDKQRKFCFSYLGLCSHSNIISCNLLIGVIDFHKQVPVLVQIILNFFHEFLLRVEVCWGCANSDRQGSIFQYHLNRIICSYL